MKWNKHTFIIVIYLLAIGLSFTSALNTGSNSVGAGIACIACVYGLYKELERQKDKDIV